MYSENFSSNLGGPFYIISKTAFSGLILNSGGLPNANSIEVIPIDHMSFYLSKILSLIA